MELWRLLLKETEREPELSRYRGSKEGFSMCQQALDPLYYQRPLEERVGVAIVLAERYSIPNVIRVSVALDPLPSLAHSITGGLGTTLLNVVARGFGMAVFQYQRCGIEHVASIFNGTDPEQATMKV